MPQKKSGCGIGMANAGIRFSEFHFIDVVAIIIIFLFHLFFFSHIAGEWDNYTFLVMIK